MEDARHLKDDQALSRGSTLPTIEEKFAERIVQLRKERGWSQEELAAKTGLSVRSISNVENAKFSATLDTIKRLADAFGLPIQLIVSA